MLNEKQPGAEAEHNRIILEWETPEFIPHPKGAVWFLIMGMLVLGFTAYAVITGSATMAIVFLLLGGMVYLTHNQEPKIIRIRVSEMGISVGDKFYQYTSLNSFWIVYNPPFVSRLYLRLSNKSLTEIKVELNHQNPVELRRALTGELPEIEGGQEKLTDIFIRLLRLQ